jgi:hypothetical protein
VWQSAYETRLSRGERAAFTYRPATALEVPVLPKLQTKAQLSDGGDQKALAIAMAKAGLILPHHWIGDVGNAVEEAFTEVFRGIHADLNFHLTNDVTTKNPYDTTGAFDSCAENFREEQGLSEERRISAFQISRNDACRWITVGERLKAYETHHKGLGRTILHVLDEAMSAHVNWIGPRQIAYLCDQTQWGGEMDESMRLEEYLYDSSLYNELVNARKPRKAKAPKPLVDVLTKPQKAQRPYEPSLSDLTPAQLARLKEEWGGVTRQMFDAAFPPWATFDQDSRGVLNLEKVKIARLRDATLLKTCTLDDLLHEVVTLQKHTARWRATLRKADHTAMICGNDDLEQSELSGAYVVYFTANDGVTDRVLDEVNDSESNCGTFIDLAYQHLFCADDPRAMEQAMGLVRPICESLRMVEKILMAIGETR